MKRFLFVLSEILFFIIFSIVLLIYAPDLISSMSNYAKFISFALIGYLIILIGLNPPTKDKIVKVHKKISFLYNKRGSKIMTIITSGQFLSGIIITGTILLMTLFIDDLALQINFFKEFVGVFNGIRSSLAIAFSAGILSLALGTILGIFSEYLGGWFENSIDYLSNLFLILPVLLLIILLVKNGVDLVFIIAFFGIAKTIKLVKGEVKRIKEMEFVEAAKALGHDELGIMFKEMLPTLSSILITQFVTLIATNIALEASAGFLHFSSQDSIGLIIRDNLLNLLRYGKWQSVIPTGLLILTILGFILISEGLKRKIKIDT